MLLEHNAKVYLAGRGKDKHDAVIEELRDQTGKTALYLPLDLADLRSVQSAAAEYQRREGELHMLFNNAGVFRPPVEMLTEQGYDLQFGVMVLGAAID